MSSVKSFFKPPLFPAFHKDSQLAKTRFNEMKITHVAILFMAILCQGHSALKLSRAGLFLAGVGWSAG